MKLEADANISYSQLMGIYQTIIDGKRRRVKDLPIAGFKEGRELEATVLAWAKSRCWPTFVDHVFSGQYTHNKNDGMRIYLDGPTAQVGLNMTARPDFVFIHNRTGCNIVDVKLGPVYPHHLVQALIIINIFRNRYHVEPNYFLLHDNATKLYEVDLSGADCNSYFTIFCLACMAFQNFNLQKGESSWGELFDGGGGLEPQWSEVFDGSNRFETIAVGAFNELIKYV